MDILKVKVKVAKLNSRIVSKNGVWIIELKSPARDGKANLELVKIVSKELGSRVEIVKGFKAKEKILRIKK